MTRTPRIYPLLILTFLLPTFASAQEKDASTPAPQTGHQSPRPKIGIALEGGGALGLAHIGVLQWFEQHHIPVDYIAGTSMGGLVGGAFATGMSADELRTLIVTTDWDVMFGSSSRSGFSERSYSSSGSVGVIDGAPSGIVAR